MNETIKTRIAKLKTDEKANREQNKIHCAKYSRIAIDELQDLLEVEVKNENKHIAENYINRRHKILLGQYERLEREQPSFRTEKEKNRIRKEILNL